MTNLTVIMNVAVWYFLVGAAVWLTEASMFGFRIGIKIGKAELLDRELNRDEIKIYKKIFCDHLMSRTDFQKYNQTSTIIHALGWPFYNGQLFLILWDETSVTVEDIIRVKNTVLNEGETK